MFRNTTDIKGIVFHYKDGQSFTEEELQHIREIYSSYKWKCLFLVESASNLIRQLEFVDYQDCIQVIPLEMMLWPNVELFEQVVRHLGLKSSEIIFISKDSAFTKRSMKLLCGVVLISEKITYSQLSNAPDAIFKSYKQFHSYVLNHSVGRNYFGENSLPIEYEGASSRVFHALHLVDGKSVNVFALGRYYGSRHYMHDLHPYSKVVLSNKNEQSKLFSRFNAQFADLLAVTIQNFKSINHEVDALCYVPARPNEQSRFEPIFDILFLDEELKNLHLQDISHSLISIRNFEKQKTLGKDDRQANVEGAFRCMANLSGKHVLVVDDVITTGATLEACARTLYDAGAKSVSFFVFAINQYEQSGLTSEYAAVCLNCSHNLRLYINSNTHRPFYVCLECDKKFDFDAIMADLNRRIASN